MARRASDLAFPIPVKFSLRASNGYIRAAGIIAEGNPVTTGSEKHGFVSVPAEFFVFDESIVDKITIFFARRSNDKRRP